jgi:transposase
VAEVFPGHGGVTGQAAKIRELEKKLRDVTMERDILKKALAYFADEQK